jgi:hypothetical protein
MIPATIDKLTDMLKPLYPPDEARRLAVEAIEKNGIEVPRRGIGNVVAAGSFSLNTQPDGNVYVASTVTSSGAANPLPADAAAARDFVEAGLEWLTANQAAMPVIREALTRVSSAAKEVTIDTEYRDDHDRLMNLAPFSVIDEIEGA